MNCAVCHREARHLWWETHWLCGSSDGKTGCARMWSTSPEFARAQEQCSGWPTKHTIPHGEYWERGEWFEQYRPAAFVERFPRTGYDFFDAYVPQLRAFVERMQHSGWRARTENSRPERVKTEAA